MTNGRAKLPECLTLPWDTSNIFVLSRDVRARKTDTAWLVHFRADAPANFGLEVSSSAFQLLCQFGEPKRFSPTSHPSRAEVLKAFVDPGFLLPLRLRFGASAI